jgi:hypothetical protein
VEAVETGVLMRILKVRYRINQIIGDGRNNLSKSRTTIGGRAGAIPRRAYVLLRQRAHRTLAEGRRPKPTRGRRGAGRKCQVTAPTH